MCTISIYLSSPFEKNDKSDGAYLGCDLYLAGHYKRTVVLFALLLFRPILRSALTPGDDPVKQHTVSAIRGPGGSVS